MNAQIFGVNKDAATRKAQRFFKERRVPVHFVDFKIKAPSKGELRRFSQKFGIDALINRESQRFQSLGFGAAHYGEDRWLEIASEEPLILRIPLVRYGKQVSIGNADSDWKSWTDA